MVQGVTKHSDRCCDLTRTREQIQPYVITYRGDGDRRLTTCPRRTGPRAARGDGPVAARSGGALGRQRADAVAGGARRDEPDAAGGDADRARPGAAAVTT